MNEPRAKTHGKKIAAKPGTRQGLPRAPSAPRARRPGSTAEATLEQLGTHPLGTAAGAVGGAVAGAVAGMAAGPVGSLAAALGGAVAGGLLGSGAAGPPVSGPVTPVDSEAIESDVDTPAPDRDTQALDDPDAPAAGIDAGPDAIPDSDSESDTDPDPDAARAPHPARRSLPPDGA